MVVPLREQKSRLSLVLRSISLLNGKFAQVRSNVMTAVQRLNLLTGRIGEISFECNFFKTYYKNNTEKEGRLCA